MTCTNRDIFASALALIGESADGFVSDYEERAPYLLGSFCTQARAIDKQIRRARKLGTQPSFSSVYLDLDTDFPLCEELISAASVYVAAMLVIDEDATLSDSLYERYCDAMATLATLNQSPLGEPAVCEPISERYFYC